VTLDPDALESRRGRPSNTGGKISEQPARSSVGSSIARRRTARSAWTRTMSRKETQDALHAAKRANAQQITTLNARRSRV